MTTRIQLRRGTAAEWLDADPTLARGEPGVEWDTGKAKIGDGTSPWSTLDYATGVPGPQGPPGIPGPPGGTYHHVQAVPASTWLISHDLGFRPSVTVADSTGRAVIGALTYLDANTVAVDFAFAFGGDAYLS